METLDFQQLKRDVHRSLLSKIDLEKLSSVNNGKAMQAVGVLIQDIINK